MRGAGLRSVTRRCTDRARWKPRAASAAPCRHADRGRRLRPRMHPEGWSRPPALLHGEWDARPTRGHCASRWPGQGLGPGKSWSCITAASTNWCCSPSRDPSTLSAVLVVSCAHNLVGVLRAQPEVHGVLQCAERPVDRESWHRMPEPGRALGVGRTSACGSQPRRVSPPRTNPAPSRRSPGLEVGFAGGGGTWRGCGHWASSWSLGIGLGSGWTETLTQFCV